MQSTNLSAKSCVPDWPGSQQLSFAPSNVKAKPSLTQTKELHLLVQTLDHMKYVLRLLPNDA